MKHLNTYIVYLILIALLLASCQTSMDHPITISNQTAMLRVDEPIIIERKALEEAWGTQISEREFPLLISSRGDTIPVQTDDLNGDGQWDELFFVTDLAPNSEQQLQIRLIDMQLAPTFEARSHIQLAAMTEAGNYESVTQANRLGVDEGLAAGVYQMEGPGWENDVVGFRNYLDARNGMDIFGKTTSEMILHEAGIIGDYHEMLHWGMDILRVGPSLGAGSIALLKEGDLHRIAPASEGTAEIITNGPLRSLLRFGFNNWEVEGEMYNVQHDISIHAGAWFYESTVKIDGPVRNSQLVTGITTIDLGHLTPTLTTHNGGVTSVSTHGNQAYDYEYLGMAIMLQTSDFSGVDAVGPEGEDINNSILVKMPLERVQPVSFRFYSAWEVSDERFADEDQFNLLLESEAYKMANPVNVSFN